MLSQHLFTNQQLSSSRETTDTETGQLQVVDSFPHWFLRRYPPNRTLVVSLLAISIIFHLIFQASVFASVLHRSPIFFFNVYTLTISANDERQPWPLASQDTELFRKYTPRSKFFLGKSSSSSLLETGQHAGGKTFFGVGTFPPSHAITIFSRTLHTFKHKGSTVSTKQKLFQAGRFHLLDWLATY